MEVREVGSKKNRRNGCPGEMVGMIPGCQRIFSLAMARAITICWISEVPS